MRIGINVPNDLIKRLEPLKPELNISQVCREALEAKVASHEQILARLDDGSINRAIGRVWEQEREFMAVVEIDWEKLGYDDAEAWVNAAELKDWEDLNRRRNFLEKEGRPLWEFRQRAYAGKPLQETKTFWDRQMELNARILDQGDEFLDWLYFSQLEVNLDEARRTYMNAWLAYTEAVWRLIVQKREERFTVSLADRGMLPGWNAPANVRDFPSPTREQPFQVVPHHSRLTDGVDPLKLNQIINNLDMKEFLAEEE